LTSTTYPAEAYLKASNPDRDDRFGESVSISRDTIVVGAPHEDSADPLDELNNDLELAGAAYVFVWDGTEWGQQAYLKAPVPQLGDRLGIAVAVSGETIVVGAPANDNVAVGGTKEDSGAAYVYMRNEDNEWNWQDTWILPQ
jgi:hypothetical protein